MSDVVTNETDAQQTTAIVANSDASPVTVDMDKIALNALFTLTSTAFVLAVLWCLRAVGFQSASSWLSWLFLIGLLVRTVSDVFHLWSNLWSRPVLGSKLAITLLCFMPIWISYVHVSRSYKLSVENVTNHTTTEIVNEEN